jgi:phosphatidylethanolamine/phosphatidyl-N-methylethanolamine N-methyltransferase
LAYVAGRHYDSVIQSPPELKKGTRMGSSMNDRPESLSRASAKVRRRWDRFSGLFDFAERWFGGSRLRRWRTLLWDKVEGKTVLEVGVGTGANFPYYPEWVTVTAIDFSAKMLKRAREKVELQNRDVILEGMDVESLKFPDNTFDTVVASLVLCSVPDPVRGLAEIRRVCKPGGKVVLLEHVLSSRRWQRFFLNLFNPMMLWTVGDNINRRTAENVELAGLTVEKVTDLSAIFKLIEARKKV